MIPNLNCMVRAIILITPLLLSSCVTLERASDPVQLEAGNLMHQTPCKRTSEMPKHMRMDHYRAPTPHCAPNGVTLNTQQLVQLMQQTPQLLLIDVLSILSRPNTEFGETKWLPNKSRNSLPDSVWLPNVGYGTLDEEMDGYFRHQLKRLSKGGTHQPIVFFCIADCWMSWNALQRASIYGYTNLYWYKNGTDGWEENGLSTQIIVPVPLKAIQD